jgi:hypothetical protein
LISKEVFRPLNPSQEKDKGEEEKSKEDNKSLARSGAFRRTKAKYAHFFKR